MEFVKPLTTLASTILLLQGAATFAGTPETKASGISLLGAYSMPLVQPTIVAPPPFRFKDNRNVHIMFTVAPEFLAKLVPTPLKPDPDKPVMILYGGHYQMLNQDLSWNEAGLIVPVLRDGKSGGYYMVVLYMDPVDQMWGREVYGYPKLIADCVAFGEENGLTSLSVTRKGKVILKATFQAEQKLETIPPSPTIPLYMVKLIPSAVIGASPEVFQLVESPKQAITVKEMRIGKGTLEFSDSPSDPFLAKIPIQQVVYAEEIVEDCTIGGGAIVMDYLHPIKKGKHKITKP